MRTHTIIQKLLSSPKFLGRDFLIEKLPKVFLKNPKGEVIIQTRFGFKIKINPVFDKNIENVIYERGVYEQGTVNFIQEFVKPGFHFVDVGANIGFLSLLAASLVGKKGKVSAFEPVSSTFDLLNENIQLNAFENTQVFPFALGNETKNVEIHSENKNRGGASIINHQKGKGESIEIQKLDGVLNQQKVDFIKIDVEGFEFEVLKGAENLIKTHHPILIIEHTLEINHTAKPYEIYEWIQNLEIYQIYKLKKGKERKSKLIKVEKKEDLPHHDNIFCMPIKNNTFN